MLRPFSGNDETNPFSSTTNEASCSPVEVASLLMSDYTSPCSQPVENSSDNKCDGKLAEHFLQVADLIEDHLTSQFSLIGLNAVRFQVLQFIAASAPEGCSQAELASEINQSESSVSTLIERMRQDRLLYRLKSNTDRRKRVLMLTEEGQQLLHVAQLSYAEQMSGLLNRLSLEQQQSLLDVLQYLEDEITTSAKKKSMPASSIDTEPLRRAA